MSDAMADAMSGIGNACAHPVPHSDARAMSDAMADADALSYAVSDACASDAVPVSALLPVSAASVPYDARTVPNAASTRVP